MKIILGKTAGFCYGVKRAINEAKIELENEKDIYCLGEIVHNESVVKELEENGMIFINNIDDAKGKVIIRAHGASKEIYEQVHKKNIEVKDLTCPKVLKTHEIGEKYSKRDYFIILIGIKDHPESIGTLSFCGKNAILIQEKEDLDEAIKQIENSGLDKILIMAQTTYNLEKFDLISKKLREMLSGKNIEVKKTICEATEIRQRETREICEKVDAMIIVGDKKSSNTNKLYDISKEKCEDVFFIQNASELEKEALHKFNIIGIMAGASTPRKDIEEVIRKMEE